MKRKMLNKIMAASMVTAMTVGLAGCGGQENTTDNNTGNTMENPGTGVSGAVEDLGDGAGGVIEDIGDGAGNVIKDVGDGIGNAVEDAGQGVGDAIKDVGDMGETAVETPSPRNR